MRRGRTRPKIRLKFLGCSAFFKLKCPEGAGIINQRLYTLCNIWRIMNEIRASQAKPNRTASLERKVISTFKSALQIQDRSSPASIIIGVFEMVQFCLN